ncbi:ArnT family glycosyltransferase [Gordonia sp. (in: high G+C Gram-positive bacteria)]|uniref:ArnT family glycosyltransferase n=1 Tax=Gordonia sp. (in: high G+C Gram-positive bacteria) TaxID=84139 RepID=UPI003BB5654F
MTSTRENELPGSAKPAALTVPERVSLAVLLVGTLLAYLWNLSANGWANSFYTAAIEAGSQSWKAWFFGSSDMANSITVDKPPVSLWIPALSVRVFGLNSWSLLVPQVLMGVASVALLYLIVRRYFGHWAGIGAGLVLATTPVAALMFRFNNPEALLILLMLVAAWATMRAIDTGRLQPMIWAGVAVGFGFLTKQLQVFLILPALVITFFVFAQGGWRRRVGHLLAALGALIVSAGWWILTVELWPADSRPYIGGSQNNSILELTLGYNGLGRLNGNEAGSVVPGGGGMGGDRMSSGAYGFGSGGFPGGGPGGGRGSMWGSPGFWRMFDAEQGGQISWLIPTALVFGIAALVVSWLARRTDTRAAGNVVSGPNTRSAFLVMFGIWMLTTIVVFSYMQGIFHSYYTAAIAPSLAGLVAAGAALCWAHREQLWVRLVLAAGSITAGIWGFVLLNRSADFVPWLRWVVLAVGIVAGLALIFVHRGTAGTAVAGAAIVAALAGPVAYTVDTLNTPAQGSIISAGPNTGGFGPGRGGPPGMGGREGSGRRGGFPGMPGGQGQSQGGPGGQAGAGAEGMGAGGPGGLLNGSKPSEEMIAMLRTDADKFTWVAAAIGSNTASGYQIESGYSVMPVGGFNGTDPSPTLEQFQRYVADGKIHYFIGGGRMGDGAGTSSAIGDWVSENFVSTTVDGVTLYNLTKPK